MPERVQSKIIVSFAMKHYGSDFAMWLRDYLMKEYRIFRVEDVYVDFAVARYFEADGANVKVALDTRDGSQSATGARPIGAMRDDWNDLFTSAMRTSRVMIVVLTEEYLRSKWCRLEAGQAIEEQARRENQGLPELKIIVLQLTHLDPTASRALFGSKASLIRASYVDGECRGLLWDKGAWRVSDGVMAKLLDEIDGRVIPGLYRARPLMNPPKNAPPAPARHRTTA